MRLNFTFAAIVLALGITTLTTLGQETNVQNEKTFFAQSVLKFTKLNTVAQQREAVAQGRSLPPIPASVSQEKSQPASLIRLQKSNVEADDKILGTAPNEETISLENATRVSDVDKWIATSREKFQRNFAIELQKINIEAGDRILQISQTDDDRKKGYELKIAALSSLIKIGEKGSQDELYKLTNELKADEKLRFIFHDSQFKNFISRQPRFKNRDDVEKFKNELKTWLNNPFISHKLVIKSGLQKIKSQAGVVEDIKNDPEFFTKFVNDLAAFVKSSENTLDENVKKEILQQIESSTLTIRGNDPKLYGKTIDDDDFNWNSLRGKYVIVKFTATWCGPCKGEIPGLISAYEKYKDKGLEIVSVYVWERGNDSDKIVQNVKKFVEDEKISWLIVSETLTEKAGQPKQGEFYGVTGVPTMLLIDKDGKIIDTQARGQHLQEKLEEIFK
ncbi:MAG: redoxin domain-containing protein [Planctomycetaceae bacterium]|jgi:thiol-disulfide isomerase/thioredoxin|nr:redoxin domain-containing protein [Planctomycetaceae bacterium]